MPPGPGALPPTLHQNHPNPFNPVTAIRFEVARAGKVTLEVYDATGALVVGLLDAPKEAGLHTVTWDGRNRSGHEVPSGVYFYRLQSGDTELTRKMILLK